MCHIKFIYAHLWKGLSEEESLELGFEVRQSGEISQIDRRQIPNSHELASSSIHLPEMGINPQDMACGMVIKIKKDTLCGVYIICLYNWIYDIVCDPQCSAGEHCNSTITPTTWLVDHGPAVDIRPDWWDSEV